MHGKPLAEKTLTTLVIADRHVLGRIEWSIAAAFVSRSAHWHRAALALVGSADDFGHATNSTPAHAFHRIECRDL